MKKLLLSIFIGLGLLTSCDMDKAPAGSLDDVNGLQSANDFMRFRNGIYSNMRSLGTGGYLYYSDIQSDQFIGLTLSGNRNGSFNNGLLYASTSEFESVFANLYARIANANYFIGKAEDAVADGNTFSDDDLTAIKRYLAEAHFARGYYYYWLMDRFCGNYTSDKADTPALGLQIVDEFNPSGDSSTYPGRSTLRETLKFINDDLDAAYDFFKSYEQTDNSALIPMSSYINSHIIEALQARIALATGDYSTAITKSESVINSGIYTLATPTSYAKMWTDDTSNELIFLPYVDANESSSISNTSYGYISYQDEVTADYIPTFDVLTSYDDNDVRFDAFFTVWQLNFEGDVQPAYVFYKYPGNTALVTGTNYRKNKPKPFRLSEQYLILAEAAAATNASGKANDALNTLRKNRITGWEDATYSGSTLVTEIRNERAKELIGEGFRLSDLRRWGVGFQRSGAYPINTGIVDNIVSTCLSVTYSESDYRYVWPIPTAEMQINPQLEGQQNPGY